MLWFGVLCGSFANPFREAWPSALGGGQWASLNVPGNPPLDCDIIAKCLTTLKTIGEGINRLAKPPSK